MKGFLVLYIAIFLFSCDASPTNQETFIKDSPKEISFFTSDSIQIFGDLYEFNKAGTILLLFHQGGSNSRGEYASIIPRLLEKNYNILAIDQRLGGQIYGNYNRTIANIPDNSFDNNYSYCDAYNNLVGALDYLINLGFTGEKILWASSYSAALSIQVAAKREDDLSGVLAFSPSSGNAVKDCNPNQYLKDLKCPLLILRPPNEMERESVLEQFTLARQYGHQTYAAKVGVHGSSMLDSNRVEGDIEPTWNVVEAFISDVSHPD